MASWMEAHTVFLVGLPERAEGQGKVDATYSRLDRSEDFFFLFRLFRCTFMTLRWRTFWFGWCCMCQDPERNTEQNRLSRELKYVFLLHFGLGKKGEKAIRHCLTARRKFYWFFITLSLKDYTKTIISCDLYSWPMSEAKVNCHTVSNQRGQLECGHKLKKPAPASNVHQLRPICSSLHTFSNHQGKRQQASKGALCIGGRELWERGDWAVCTWENAAVTEHESEITETLSCQLLHPLSTVFPKQGHTAKGGTWS